MEIKNQLVDELLKGYQKPEDIIGEKGLLKQLTKALLSQFELCELKGTQARSGGSEEYLWAATERQAEQERAPFLSK